ncbi:MAG: hypothetical protein IKS55_09600 [Oscillospiraceae bacterium]|nr:hypothetical protein [Oscillospiraceae bacterium]
MNEQPKNREWVKNAAIVFLSVILVLTFFSNTIMNRSLPEAATQEVVDGSIVSKVRGTGTVTATGNHQVKMEKTRVIRSVLVKAGQEVAAGDVLFTLGEGSSDEIAEAELKVHSLQSSYNRQAATSGVYSYSAAENNLSILGDRLDEATEAMLIAKEEAEKEVQDQEQLEVIKEKLEKAIKARDEAKDHYDQVVIEQAGYEELQSLKEALADIYTDLVTQGLIDGDLVESTYLSEREIILEQITRDEKELMDLGSLEDPASTTDIEELRAQAAQARLDAEALRDEGRDEEAVLKEQEAEDLEASIAEYEEKQIEYEEKTEIEEELKGKIEILKDALAEHDRIQREVYDTEQKNEKVNAAKNEYESSLEDVDRWSEALNSILSYATDGYYNEVYKNKLEAYRQANINYQDARDALDRRKAEDAQSQAAKGVDLNQIKYEIEAAKKKLDELTGEDGAIITAKVAGTVTSVECTAGDKKMKDDVLCTIEVPDMGYTMSFSVTNEQASRLRIGDQATVSNFYWGNEVTATLSSIKTDPKKAQSNKLLTFDLEGNVTTGSELTISVGQKSANYDLIVPSSAIRSDANGSFVLKVEAKNSPLGNRYIAKRVPVEVLASDDNNSAVTAELQYGDYVITTSSAPIKSGSMVRLASS